MNGYFEENNGNKYLALVHTNERKEKIKDLEKDYRFNQNNNYKLRWMWWKIYQSQIYFRVVSKWKDKNSLHGNSY